MWRGQQPPGCSRTMDEKTGMWNDVGDKKAREKTSQALQKKATLIRKQQETEHNPFLTTESRTRGESTFSTFNFIFDTFFQTNDDDIETKTAMDEAVIMSKGRAASLQVLRKLSSSSL